MDEKQLSEKRKSILENFREAYKSTVQFITGKISFKDYPQPDGTTLRIDADAPAIGVPISVVSADGTVTPVADGAYELTIDGKTFNIKVESGLITDMQPGQEEPLEKPDDPPPPASGSGAQTNTEMSDETKKIFEDFEKRIAALESAVKASGEKAMAAETEVTAQKEIVIKLQKDNEALLDLNKKTFGLIEEFSKLPSAFSTDPPPDRKKMKEDEMEKWRRKVAGEI